jgi:hypothetical protein
MPCITTCLKCARCYEEVSEEQANAPDRMCSSCWTAQRRYMEAITGIDQRATAKLIRGLRASSND